MAWLKTGGHLTCRNGIPWINSIWKDGLKNHMAHKHRAGITMIFILRGPNLNLNRRSCTDPKCQVASTGTLMAPRCGMIPHGTYSVACWALPVIPVLHIRSQAGWKKQLMVYEPSVSNLTTLTLVHIQLQFSWSSLSTGSASMYSFVHR